MEPGALTVYASPFDKQRIGREYDGGYVIVDIPNVTYSLLLAGGVETDITFEEDFVKKYGTRCITFDGTIPCLPPTAVPMEFVRKNIGHINTPTLTNLHDIIDTHDNIFVKMDIEGGEIPWITSLSSEQMNKFEQIVMEFHNPFSHAEGVVFNKLNEHHVLVHFHPNNCCGLRNHKGVLIPNIFECTYVHKKHFSCPPRLNTDKIPSVIDMKNVRSMNEIYISHPPFVN